MKKSAAIVYIDDNTAQVTKAFMKKASIFGTEEFKLWREYKKEFPNAKMITKSIKKNPDQNRRRNMTYANMVAYINTYPEKEAQKLLEEFEIIKERSKIQKGPYQYVMYWFETKFKGFDDLNLFVSEKAAAQESSEEHNV